MHMLFISHTIANRTINWYTWRGILQYVYIKDFKIFILLPSYSNEINFSLKKEKTYAIMIYVYGLIIYNENILKATWMFI